MESMAVCRSLCFWQCVRMCQTLNASQWPSTISALGPDHSPPFHLSSDSAPQKERQSNFTAGWRPFNLSDEGASPRAHVCTHTVCMLVWTEIHTTTHEHPQNSKRVNSKQGWLCWQAHQLAFACHFSPASQFQGLQWPTVCSSAQLLQNHCYLCAV